MPTYPFDPIAMLRRAPFGASRLRFLRTIPQRVELVLINPDDLLVIARPGAGHEGRWALPSEPLTLASAEDQALHMLDGIGVTRSWLRHLTPTVERDGRRLTGITWHVAVRLSDPMAQAASAKLGGALLSSAEAARALASASGRDGEVAGRLAIWPAFKRLAADQQPVVREVAVAVVHQGKVLLVRPGGADDGAWRPPTWPLASASPGWRAATGLLTTLALVVRPSNFELVQDSELIVDGVTYRTSYLTVEHPRRSLELHTGLDVVWVTADRLSLYLDEQTAGVVRRCRQVIEDREVAP